MEDCADLNWLIPVAVGLAGFVLAVLWDLVKFRRDRSARERAAIGGLLEELRANGRSAGSDATTLEIEKREFAPDGRIMINSVSPLGTGAWAIARVNLPQRLAEDVDLIQRLRIIDRLTVELNTMSASRETLKLRFAYSSQVAREARERSGTVPYEPPTYPEILEQMAKLIRHMQDDLIQRIEEIDVDLQPFAAMGPRRTLVDRLPHSIRPIWNRPPR